MIRSVLFSEASSPYSFSGVDIRQAIAEFDFADLPAEGDAARDAIKARVADVLKSGCVPLSLGGDHSITYPILQAMHAVHGALNILHIDAHPDLYPEFDGDPYSHASPFYRAVDDGLIGALVQVGLRSISPGNRAFGDANGVHMLGADEIDKIPYGELAAPLYISIDLDGFDPAFAPGVSHPEPGGLSAREVFSMLKRLNAPIVGADIVELNPERDLNMLTAHLAARLVKELAAMAP